MLENQSVKERLIAYIRYLGIGQRKFETSCGLANGYVNNIRKSITPQKLQIIAQQYPELNTGWLITGEGDMLRAAVIQRTGDIGGDASNVNVYNSSSALNKALDNLAEQIELTKNAQRQTDKAQEQIDRLIGIIENTSTGSKIQMKSSI